MRASIRGVDLRDPPVFPALALDFNLTVMRSPNRLFSVLKTEVTRLRRMEDLTQRTGSLTKVSRTWIQREDAEPVKPVKLGIPGDNGLSSMTTYPVDDIFRHLAETATGVDVWFLLGVQLASEKNSRVFRFKASVSPEDSASYMACARALVLRAQKDAAAK